MTLVRIDFAPRTLWRAIARTHVVTWLVAAVGLALCLSVGVTLLDVSQQNHARQDKLQRLQSQLAERSGRKPVSKKSSLTESQAAAINRTILQLNLPWRDVLDAIEEATPPTIALLALEPDAKKHALKGTAEAKSSDEPT